ncbi:hypothetical protein CDL12_20112 [Handroanthus impetiginosus]|uniref:Retrotransposon gag domain-containing protein n=1 Tax=Handroanthus impetiginosus TaxID=429701 RepID=A0A2G9GPU4_9LAMI|nr:hypothetical protein CDL12_20112 [Handroanthus impetiginosus]
MEPRRLFLEVPTGGKEKGKAVEEVAESEDAISRTPKPRNPPNVYRRQEERSHHQYAGDRGVHIQTSRRWVREEPQTQRPAISRHDVDYRFRFRSGPVPVPGYPGWRAGPVPSPKYWARDEPIGPLNPEILPMFTDDRKRGRTINTLVTEGWVREEPQTQRPRPAISRHDVDEISGEVERLSKRLDELKRRGAVHVHREMLDLEKNNSPFCEEILAEYVPNDFRIPELPNYDGKGDPQRHVNNFERIIRLYAISDAQKAQIFATTLDEAADEWFTSLVPGTVVNYTQLARKFIYHFASKKKAKRPYTHLFSIQQKENEPLREFMDRFNTESLLVQDLKADLIVSILLNSLLPGSFRSKLSRSPPKSIEELMIMSEKYINEEEFNKMKEQGGPPKNNVFQKEKKELKLEARSDKDKQPFKGKYQHYTPLAITRAQALMAIEDPKLLQWPKKTRDTPAKMTSKKYCHFHKDRGHDTEDCFQLKDEIERLIQGYFKEYILKKARSRGLERR